MRSKSPPVQLDQNSPISPNRDRKHNVKSQLNNVETDHSRLAETLVAEDKTQREETEKIDNTPIQSKVQKSVMDVNKELREELLIKEEERTET